MTRQDYGGRKPRNKFSNKLMYSKNVEHDLFLSRFWTELFNSLVSTFQMLSETKPTKQFKLFDPWRSVKVGSCKWCSNARVFMEKLLKMVGSKWGALQISGQDQSVLIMQNWADLSMKLKLSELEHFTFSVRVRLQHGHVAHRSLMFND